MLVKTRTKRSEPKTNKKDAIYSLVVGCIHVWLEKERKKVIIISCKVRRSASLDKKVDLHEVEVEVRCIWLCRMEE